MSYYFASDPMGLQSRLNAMTPEQRQTQAAVISDAQYGALFGDRSWSPQNDEEWLAVWCRNRDASGWETAAQFGKLPTYIFTLPARPFEALLTTAARQYPSPHWESVGMLMAPAALLFSGFVWWQAFKWVKERV